MRQGSGESDTLEGHFDEGSGIPSGQCEELLFSPFQQSHRRDPI